MERIKFKMAFKSPRIVCERFFYFELPTGYPGEKKTARIELGEFLFIVPLFGEAHLGISIFSRAETRNAVRPAGHFAVRDRELNLRFKLCSNRSQSQNIKQRSSTSKREWQNF